MLLQIRKILSTRVVLWLARYFSPKPNHSLLSSAKSQDLGAVISPVQEISMAQPKRLNWQGRGSGGTQTCKNHVLRNLDLHRKLQNSRARRLQSWWVCSLDSNDSNDSNVSLMWSNIWMRSGPPPLCFAQTTPCRVNEISFPSSPSAVKRGHRSPNDLSTT